MSVDASGCPPAPVDWTPTRAAGLARLESFLPHAGRDYARDRNIDRGPSDRSNVSALSPWIRRRLITEEEVIAAVLKRHNFAAAEKFVQEVFWRSYWKGWLEVRPSVLIRFDAERRDLRETWVDYAGLRLAMDGRTGIACFDAWVKELIETGWLHNHARMWFASIWIFTLRLPWQLGAEFFFEHLLDADPASNMLSWRWVAGLHTRGKHYLARAANIRENTLGRFDPFGELDEAAAPLSEDFGSPTPAPVPAGGCLKAKRVGVLLHDEDLHPESWGFTAEVAGSAALMSPGRADSPAGRFSRGALEDGLARTEVLFATVGVSLEAGGIVGWARRLAVDEIVTAYAPVGSCAQLLDKIQADLQSSGIRLVRLQRRFDARVWPHTNAGFFKLRELIPALISGAL